MASRPVEFRVLGPIEVLVGGSPAALNGGRLRSLLAALLVRRRQVLTPDQLIEDVWGVRAHRTARASLHNLVSGLRAVVSADVLVTTGAGYALEADDDQIDGTRFERLVAEAMRREARDRARELTTAVALWRGSPFVDVRYESFAQPEIVRLEELHVWAVEELLDARLELGHAEAVVAELAGLVAAFPLRERPRRMLMVALHRAGRPLDAVAVYVDWHRRLTRAGFDPAEATALMRESLEQQAPALASGLLRATRAPPRTSRSRGGH
jgi:DNA-binding SARP family transcriptional activator